MIAGSEGVNTDNHKERKRLFLSGEVKSAIAGQIPDVHESSTADASPRTFCYLTKYSYSVFNYVHQKFDDVVRSVAHKLIPVRWLTSALTGLCTTVHQPAKDGTDQRTFCLMGICSSQACMFSIASKPRRIVQAEGARGSKPLQLFGVLSALMAQAGYPR